MISRRHMLLGTTAAMVVAPAAATALPARVLDAKPLDFVPCDGRELPIAGYEKLFEVLKSSCSWSADMQTFRVPDMRGLSAQYPVLANDMIVLEDVISTGHDPRAPTGTILLMEPPHER